MISIHRFILSMILLIIVVLYSVFFSYYLNDQQQKANLITENIRHDLSETAYIIASDMTDINSVATHKSFLHRKVANNPLISGMMVAYGNQILLATDNTLQTPPAEKDTLSSFTNISSERLVQHSIFEAPIKYFIQDKPAELSLFIYTDTQYIENFFSQNKLHFFINFGLIPSLILVLLWLALRSIITRPLEIMRQYAYYQSEVPKCFKLRELEYVRASMVQTFERLDHEKKELYRLARTDHLSGLANRNQLNERLGWLISEASRSNEEFALLFLDLDNFKTINDSLGHDIGDELLIKVSELLQEVLRQYDIISRVGGDEFVIVLSHYHSHIELTHIIQRVLQKISEFHIIQTHPIAISASVGVVFYPKDGADITTLMKNADIAMYDAKNSGKNQFKFFTEQLHQQILAEIELEQDMRQALKNKEFTLYYQPKTEVKTGKIIGVEALIRWMHPTKGMIPPYRFIPAAEKTGIIIELGKWVLQEATRQQVAWKNTHNLNLKISINLSAVQFLDEYFDQHFKAELIASTIDPCKLDIEITESIFLENSQKNLDSLQKMRALGVSISLDDFGTGYSSLSYLKRLPIDTLKIDKSFMDDFAAPSGAIFIETIVKIAQTLNLDVVAEGIESQAQLSYLQAIGCNAYQGYFCSPPISAEAFEKALIQNELHCPHNDNN